MLSILADIAPSRELPFTSRLSLCTKDPVECVHFWIAWKVLKPSQEQMDSTYMGNEFSCKEHRHQWRVLCACEGHLTFSSYYPNAVMVGIPFLGKNLKKEPSKSPMQRLCWYKLAQSCSSNCVIGSGNEVSLLFHSVTLHKVSQHRRTVWELCLPAKV